MGRATSSRSAKRPFFPCPHQLGLPIEGPPPWLPRDSQPFCVTSEGLLISSGDPKVGCGLWGGLGPSEEGFFVPSQRLTGRKWRVFPRWSSPACLLPLPCVRSNGDEAGVWGLSRGEDKMRQGEAGAGSSAQPSRRCEVRGGLCSHARVDSHPAPVSHRPLPRLPQTVTRRGVVSAS